MQFYVKNEENEQEEEIQYEYLDECVNQDGENASQEEYFVISSVPDNQDDDDDNNPNVDIEYYPTMPPPLANLKDARRRAFYNEQERKRRYEIAECFDRLNDIVPATQNKKTSRANTLRKACEYINYLKRRNNMNANMIAALRIQNEKLTKQLHRKQQDPDEKIIAILPDNDDEEEEEQYEAVMEDEEEINNEPIIDLL